jgi:hypothetical protein
VHVNGPRELLRNVLRDQVSSDMEAELRSAPRPVLESTACGIELQYVIVKLPTILRSKAIIIHMLFSSGAQQRQTTEIRGHLAGPKMRSRPADLSCAEIGGK